MTTIIDVTVSGGNVTVIDTGTFSLEQGKFYEMFGELRASATCNCNLWINGNTTTSNYEAANFGSVAPNENLSSAATLQVTGADEITHFSGSLQKTGNKLNLTVERYDRLDSNNSFIRWSSVFDINDVIEATSIEITSNVANTLKAGSFIKIVEVI